MNQTKAQVYVLLKKKSVFANMNQVINVKANLFLTSNQLVATITVTTKFVVTALTTKLVVPAVMMKLVLRAVTTKLAITAVTTKLVVSACF